MLPARCSLSLFAFTAWSAEQRETSSFSYIPCQLLFTDWLLLLYNEASMTWWLHLVHERQRQTVYLNVSASENDFKQQYNPGSPDLHNPVSERLTVIMFCLVCSSLACCTAVTSANVSVTHPVQWEQLSLCLDFRQTRNYFTCGSGSSSLKLIAVKDAQSNASKKPARCRYNRKKANMETSAAILVLR